MQPINFVLMSIITNYCITTNTSEAINALIHLLINKTILLKAPYEIKLSS